MPNDLRIQIESSFNAAPIKAGMADAANAVQVGGKQMQLAFASIGQSVGEASDRALNSLYPTTDAVDQVGQAAEVAAPKIERLAPAAAGAGNGFRGMTSAMGAARVEMGVVAGSAGMIESGFARVAAQSSLLGPIIQLAFPAFAALAFIDILDQVVTGIEKASDSVVGYTKAVQEAEKEDVKWSQGNEARALTLDQAHQKINSTVKESGDLASETFGSKWVKAMEKSTHATSAFYAGLSDPLVGFTALFDAEEAGANRNAKLSKNFQALTKDIFELTVAQDRATISINDAKEAAAKSAFDGDSNSKAQQLRVEIAALAEKQRLEESIARAEAAQKGGGPVEQAAAAKPIGEEYYYKRIELTNQLAAAEKEAARKQEEANTKLIDSFERIEKEKEKGAREDAKFATEQSGFASKIQTETLKREIEAIGKLTEARKKDGEEQAKQNEQNALHRVDAAEAQTKGTATLQIDKLPSENLSAIDSANATNAIQQKEIAQLRAFEEQKFQIQLDYFSKQLSLLEGGDPSVQTAEQYEKEKAAVARVYGEIEALKIQHDAKMQSLDLQAQNDAQKKADTIAKAWDRGFSEINRGFTSALSGIFDGTRTVSNAFAKMGSDIALGAIAGFEKMTLAAAENELRMLLVHTATTQTKLGLDQSAAGQQIAISAATSLKEVEHQAAAAAAKAYQALAGVPIIGPVLGAAAAAATFAGVMAFGSIATAERGAVLPSDMLVQAHANEMILPAQLSKGIQGLIAGGAGGPGGAGGAGGNAGDTHIHYNSNVTAMDAEGFSRVMAKNSREVEKHIRGAIRNGRLRDK